jgi:peptidoglycan-associated lipoprotein
MSAKIWIVSVVFLAWISVSWKWYTCDINGLCPSSEESSPSPLTAIEPALNLEPTEAPLETVVETLDAERLDAEKRLTSLLPITFTFMYNSELSYWRQKSKTEVQELCSLLNAATGSLEISGHCDSMGEAPNAVDLGLKRANAAMDYLVECGCNESQISTMSSGNDIPLNSGASVNERAQNRRVEIQLSHH